jgi:hypothetical protein
MLENVKHLKIHEKTTLSHTNAIEISVIAS